MMYDPTMQMYNDRMAQLQNQYNDLQAMRMAHQNWGNPYYPQYQQSLQSLQQQMDRGNSINNMQNNQNNNMAQPMPPVDAIRGRVVDDINAVVANDVVMDGKPTIFPTKDYACIYVKRWNANGTIDTVPYVPAPDMAPGQGAQNPADILNGLSNAFAAFVQEVGARFDRVEQYISSISIAPQPAEKQQQNKKRQEGNKNEQSV